MRKLLSPDTLKKEGQVAKVQVLGVGERILVRRDVALPIPLRLKSVPSHEGPVQWHSEGKFG
jgi:hypothetical protein